MALIQTPKFLHTITIPWLNQVAAKRTFCRVFFRLFSPSRSRTPLPPPNTLHMIRSWRSVEVIFVSSLFSSSFCSQLRRARIKAPQGTATSSPLMPSIARHRHKFNPLPHRDPTSNRKKNPTVLQPQNWRVRGPIICGNKVLNSYRPHSQPVPFWTAPLQLQFSFFRVWVLPLRNFEGEGLVQYVAILQH